jgi:hypothetical protein
MFPRDMVCLRNICVDTLHKGDTDDDDNDDNNNNNNNNNKYYAYAFRPPYSPGVDSASNRNEYNENFLGVKDGRCVGLIPLPPSFAV